MDYGLKNHIKSVTMSKEKICTICTLWLNFNVEEIMSFSDLMLFALSSNQDLAERVSKEMGLPLGKSTVRQFQMGKSKSISRSLFVGRGVYSSIYELSCQ